MRRFNPHSLPQRVLLFPLVLVLVYSGENHAQTAPPRASQPEVRVTAAQLQQLRPALMPDLKDLLIRMDGGEPTPEDLNGEFEACKFTALQLGSLGPAVMVQDLNFAGKTNLALINVYRLENGQYKQLAAGQGFLEFLNGPADIPDILYGWTSGVCHAIYYRLRYSGGKYTEDACNQEEEPAADEDNCAVKTCEGSGATLPTFPDPWRSGQMRGSNQRYILGPALTAEEIEHAGHTEQRAK